ncbi:MAG: hypothetical protein JWQ71_4904 [Pedosphaera sp.]|nr:hypothetical protein [Pedosphaera sp.]
MGMRVTFKCAGCGYTALVSGGPDGGMIAGTTTIACADCQELRDIPVEIWNSDEEQPVIQCPVSVEHSWRQWQFPDNCPKCDAMMERDEAGEWVRWD